MFILGTLLGILLGVYLIGAIPFGLIFVKLIKGVDIREHGSGNIGATNVMRVIGPVWGSIVFILDVLKGFLPTFFIAKYLTNNPKIDSWIVVLVGIVAVLGHTFSVFLKFKGGKGVATSLGVIIGLNPLVAAIAYGVYLVVLAISRYVSLGSVVATASVFLMFLFWKHANAPLSYQLLAGILFVAIIYKHIPNLKRIANKTEPKIGQKINVD